MQLGWRTFVFVILLLAMLVFSWPLLFKPLKEQREAALRTIAERQQKLRDLENLRQNTAITRKEVEQWQEAIKTLEHRLPAATEMDKMITDFWEKASANSLTVKSVRTPKPVEGANYDEQPIRMIIEGPFNSGPSKPGFYNFLSQIEALQRLTKITDMKIDTDSKRNGFMVANVSLTIYYEGNEKVAVAKMSQQEWNSNNVEDLGAGTTEGLSEETSSRFKPRVNTSTLALVASFAAALVVLYFLGLQTKPRPASASDVEREQKLEDQFQKAIKDINSTKTETKTAGAGLADVLNGLNAKAVAVRDMSDNPFFKDLPRAEVVPIAEAPKFVPESKSVDPNVRLAVQEFNSLRLQMIMIGAHPSALVNNMVMQPGTRLKYLVVDEIQPQAVVFKYVEEVEPGSKEPATPHKWTLTAQGPEKH